MIRFGHKFAAVLSTCAIGAGLAASPAGAASSPPPRVQIGQLSGPVTGPGGTPEYWLDVSASDRDGIVTEIAVEWTGDNYHSVVFADRPCLLIPSAPGEEITMRIPVRLPGPGSYRVQVHAESSPTCGSVDTQSGPERQRRFRVTA